MPEPTILIALTQVQRDIVVAALANSKLDTERYLSGYPKDDMPGPLDTCCAAHMERFEERLRDRDARKTRRSRICTLIAGIAAEEPETWQNSIPRELADCLCDREDPESLRAAEWLHENENSDAVWDLVGKLMDDITRLANEDRAQ